MNARNPLTWVLVVAALLFGGWWVVNNGAGATAGIGGGDRSVMVPNLTGMALGLADEEAEDNKVGLRVYDSLGKGRAIEEPEEWKVCFQSPSAGTYSVPVTALIGAVMVNEQCPPVDDGVGPVIVDNRAMPDFVGRTGQVVRMTLGESAAVTYKDGDNREVGEGDLGKYLVCTQTPQPGEPYRGVPVTINLSKEGTPC